MKPFEFLAHTPKTNCGECGQATCLAFAVAVTRGGADPSQCPYIDRAALPGGVGGVCSDKGIEKVESGQEKRDLALITHLKAKISPVDFADVAGALGAEYCRLNGEETLCFSYLGRPVELSKTDVRLAQQGLVDPRDQILLYNYVAFGGGNPPDGHWIGMESLPNSISKVRTLAVYCEQKIARHFSGRPQRLRELCQTIGGIAAKGEQNAAVAMVLPALPHVPLYLLFWDKESEDGFEAKVKVLFDRDVLTFLDIESLVFTAERTTERLIELDR